MIHKVVVFSALVDTLETFLNKFTFTFLTLQTVEGCSPQSCDRDRLSPFPD